MILYLDTSALVKRYLVEAGTSDVNHWISLARPASTGLVTRAELGAAISKAGRLGWISTDEKELALSMFRSEWESFARLPVNEATVQRADDLACKHGLRGYDSIHLACALLYHEALGEPVQLASYDHSLWQAGKAEGFAVLPAFPP